MLGGQIPLAIAGEDVVINANLQGGDLVIIGAGIDHFLFQIYATKAINSIADLKGKKLGITRIAAATDFAARYVLAQNKLAPSTDVALLQMGGQPEIMAGLQSGAIDAGVLSPPTTAQAKKADFHDIANLSKYDVTYYQSPIGGKKAWLKDHRDVTLSVMKAYSEGIAYIHKDKAGTMKIIGKYTKTDDPATLEDAYEQLLLALPKNPIPKVDAIKAGLDQIAADVPAAKTADPSSFIDPSFVEELQKSGFIDALYK